MTSAYPFRLDDAELDRLDLQHQICYNLFDEKLALAPIEGKTLGRVLDVCTGSGLWAMDFAKLHPESEVIGVDLFDVAEQGKPSNCTFITADAETPWSVPSPYDFIHFRCVFTCFKSPATVINSAFDALAPGGYLEMQDPVVPWRFETPPAPDSPFVLWNKINVEASIAGGRPWNNVVNYAEWMREAGFVDVEEKKYFLPTGSWSPGDKDEQLGNWQLLNMLGLIDAFTPKNLAYLGWDEEKSEEFIEAVKEEFRSGKIKGYYDILVVVGKKPS